MSRASKITLASSLLFTIGTTVGVFYLQDQERELLRQGPIKDAERVSQKLNSKQQTNLNEFELQKKLKKDLESNQPLSGEIIQGIDKDS